VIPDSVFSSSVIDAGWRYRVPDRFKPLESFTRDTMGQDFRFWVEGGYLWSQAEGGQPVQELPLPSATRISACYNQNGRLHVVYNTAASCFFRWYDSQAGGMVTTEYAGVLDAQCILDDPRQYWSAVSDVLLIYTLAGVLNVREQRDRFGVIRTSKAAPGLKVIAAGMNDANRLQVECIPVA